MANRQQKDQAWREARKRHRLSSVHVQMARELGMNPQHLGKLDNHRQQPWKAPLPQYIEHLYRKRFGRDRPAATASAKATVTAPAVRSSRRAGSAVVEHAADPIELTDLGPGLLAMTDDELERWFADTARWGEDTRCSDDQVAVDSPAQPSRVPLRSAHEAAGEVLEEPAELVDWNRTE